jgi:hypothetical protein
MEPRAGGGAADGSESGHALVIWAKVPGTTAAAAASGRPAPYNAIDRGTPGAGAAPDVDFDLSHRHP